MNVVCVNPDGKKVDMKTWVTIPAPDNLDRNGLDQVGTYVARLITSDAALGCLFIASRDGTTACVVMREAGQLKIKDFE